MGAAASAIGLLLLATACAHSPPKGMGRLRIICCASTTAGCAMRDTESSVSIDGTAAGTCGDWPDAGREVQAGPHKVVITPPVRGLDPEHHDVVVPENGQVTVKMGYEPMPE
jgi:hypothetical protein